MIVSHRLFTLIHFLSFLAAIAIVFCIFWGADSDLALTTLHLSPPYDKLLHLSVYGSIAFLFRSSGILTMPFLVWCVVVVVGALDELHQMNIIGRTAALDDLAADAFGAMLGLILYWLFIRYWVSRRVVILD